jgi:hypothetical protein
VTSQEDEGQRAVARTHLEDGTSTAITGAGGYFGGAGEVIVWNLCTHEHASLSYHPLFRAAYTTGAGLTLADPSVNAAAHAD